MFYCIFVLMQMRGMQKRIKQKSLKIYTLCVLGRLPMWVQHPGSISKHGASPMYTQPFHTEKNHKSSLTSWTVFIFILLSTNNELHLNRERHYLIFLHQLVSFVLFQIQALCNSPSLTTARATFTPVGRGGGKRWAQSRTYLGMDQLPLLAQVLIS